MAGDAGELQRFLAERYCYYQPGRGGSLRRIDLHSAPFPLQPAEAEVHHNTLASAAGVPTHGTQPALSFIKHQELLAWPPRRVA